MTIEEEFWIISVRAIHSEGDVNLSNSVSIHPIFAKTFQSETIHVDLLVARQRKSNRITEVSRSHPLGTTNVCTEFTQ